MNGSKCYKSDLTTVSRRQGMSREGHASRLRRQHFFDPPRRITFPKSSIIRADGCLDAKARGKGDGNKRWRRVSLAECVKARCALSVHWM